MRNAFRFNLARAATIPFSALIAVSAIAQSSKQPPPLQRQHVGQRKYVVLLHANCSSDAPLRMKTLVAVVESLNLKASLLLFQLMVFILFRVVLKRGSVAW